MPGAAADILRTLEAFGLSGTARSPIKAVVTTCIRHTPTASKQPAGVSLLLQPQRLAGGGNSGCRRICNNGRCRNPQQRPDTQNKMPAWRIQVPDRVIGFSDGIVGHYAQNLAHDIGDFVLLRADGYWAYQLAVIADDADQGITHIVRGQDLLVSTPRQIYLQQCLGVPTPSYAHLPLLTNSQGQNGRNKPCPGFRFESKEQLLRQVLTYLNLPEAPAVNRPQELLDWAVAHWQMDKIPKSSIITK